MVIQVVYFFVDEEVKCRKKQFHSTINSKVRQSLERMFIYFLTNEQL